MTDISDPPDPQDTLFDNKPEDPHKYDPYRGHPPYVAGSATSKAAADSMKAMTGTLQKKVYMAIVIAGDDGMTDEEIQSATAMNPSSSRPRRRELYLMGYIKKKRDDSGDAVTRPTRSGRKAQVYVAT